MKKRWLTLMCAVTAGVLLTGCSQKTETSAPTEAPKAETAAETKAAEPEAAETEAAGEHRVFAMTTMGEASFWDAVADGIHSVIDERGDELVFVEGKHGDAGYQQSIIEDFIAQDVDLVFYNPTDSAASITSLELMKEAEIPIINFDSACADLSFCLSYCATDNYNAGVTVAEYMMEEHPEGGKVAIIEYVAVESSRQRSEGFADTVKASGKWEIVSQLDGGNTTDGALPVAEDIITANPDLDCIFAGNDEMGLGAYSAITGAGAEIDLYSINGGPEAKKAMLEDGEEGVWRATGAQSPIGMGKKIAEIAYQHFDGETVEPEYLIDAFIICPANIEEYGHQEWQ